jgi:hypothetical protein
MNALQTCSFSLYSSLFTNNSLTSRPILHDARRAYIHSHSRVDKQPRSGSNIFTARKFTLLLNKSCGARRRPAAEKLACKVYLRQYRSAAAAADDAHTAAKVSTGAPGGQCRNCERHAAVCACCLFCSHKVNNSLPGFLQK